MERVNSAIKYLVQKYQSEARSPRLYGTDNFTDSALRGLEDDGLRGMLDAMTNQLSRSGEAHMLPASLRASGLLFAGSFYLAGSEISKRGIMPGIVSQSRVGQWFSNKVAEGVMLLKQRSPAPCPSPA